MSNLINIGLEKKKRQRMIADGASPEAIAAQDAKIAALQTPPNTAKITHDNAIRTLIGEGMDDLNGPEMTALRERIRAAEARAVSAMSAKPMTSGEKIAAGLKARQSKPRDDTHDPNWEAEKSLRRT